MIVSIAVACMLISLFLYAWLVYWSFTRGTFLSLLVAAPLLLVILGNAWYFAFRLPILKKQHEESVNMCIREANVQRSRATNFVLSEFTVCTDDKGKSNASECADSALKELSYGPYSLKDNDEAKRLIYVLLEHTYDGSLK